MSVRSECRRLGLRLIVNEEPQLNGRRREVHEATAGGEEVDPFEAGVTFLMKFMKKEHGRILAERPGEGPDVLVTLPEGCRSQQIDEAIKRLRNQGWEVWPGGINTALKVYVGCYAAEA